MPGLDWFPLPQLTDPTAALIRSAYGLLLLVHLLATLPQARRFFVSERWGGYGESCWQVDLLQNPVACAVLQALWLGCAACLAAGRGPLAAAALNLALCRYYHVHMRWKGVLRGLGAPGFLCCWLAGAVFLLELTGGCAPGLRPLALLVLQVDFALIMFVAGWYKLRAGYVRGEGMEYGLVNPQWGRWWRWYRRLPSGHWFFRFNNFMAWSGEVAAGALMLFPATRFWGALFILGSFAYIAANIRLLALPGMVMVACLLFFGPGTPGGVLLAPVAAWAPPSPDPGFRLPAAGAGALALLLGAYLVLLPPAYAGLYYNFYCRKALPGRWQAVLERYTNYFGLILWRVFSADITNFFIRLYRQPPGGGPRELVSAWGAWRDRRYGHVGEAITVTSLFTTLKYYPGGGPLFRDRLLRYARTVACPDGGLLVFEYVSIRKEPEGFTFVPFAEFRVDPARGRVEEVTLDDRAAVRSPLGVSPLHPGARPGSYAPART
jgi:hypothetical protein